MIPILTRIYAKNNYCLRVNGSIARVAGTFIISHRNNKMSWAPSSTVTRGFVFYCAILIEVVLLSSDDLHLSQNSPHLLSSSSPPSSSYRLFHHQLLPDLLDDSERFPALPNRLVRPAIWGVRIDPTLLYSHDKDVGKIRKSRLVHSRGSRRGERDLRCQVSLYPRH